MLRFREYRCTLRVRVYGTAIPQDAFPVTNWFSQEAICRFHGVEKGTPTLYDMVRRYAPGHAEGMHQTMFYIELDDDCVAAQGAMPVRL